MVYKWMQNVTKLQNIFSSQFKGPATTRAFKIYNVSDGYRAHEIENYNNEMTRIFPIEFQSFLKDYESKSTSLPTSSSHFVY